MLPSSSSRTSSPCAPSRSLLPLLAVGAASSPAPASTPTPAPGARTRIVARARRVARSVGASCVEEARGDEGRGAARDEQCATAVSVLASWPSMSCAASAPLRQLRRRAHADRARPPEAECRRGRCGRRRPRRRPAARARSLPARAAAASGAEAEFSRAVLQVCLALEEHAQAAALPARAAPMSGVVPSGSSWSILKWAFSMSSTAAKSPASMASCSACARPRARPECARARRRARRAWTACWEYVS